MNRLPLLSASLALALLSAAPAAPAAAELPVRRAGLWETSVETDGKFLHSTRQCIDAQTDKRVQEMGVGVSNASCSKKDVRREGDRIVSDTVCTIGQTTMTSRAVISGDFNSRIRTESDTRYDPPMMGKATSKAVVTSIWRGECPAGWKPGDMEMPGGRARMNVNDVLKAAGK